MNTVRLLVPLIVSLNCSFGILPQSCCYVLLTKFSKLKSVCMILKAYFKFLRVFSFAAQPTTNFGFLKQQQWAEFLNHLRRTCWVSKFKLVVPPK